MTANEDVTTVANSIAIEPIDRRSTPFNLLKCLPPKIEVETKRTLKKAISANKALAELRTAGDLIPNQALLIRAIVLQEAKLSSEIENIVTTNDDLYKAFSEDPEKAEPATKEVLRYEESLWHGFQHLRGGGILTPRLFTDVARIIKQYDIGVRDRPGTRVVNRRTMEPIYAPPEGEPLIRSLLDNLCEYLNCTDDTDPLIKMAVAHYQFEAIHPFPDGNGRTGRVVNILYLVQQELLGIPVLYLSRFIIQNKAAYYDGLRLVTEQNAWEEWILYILDGIEQTAKDTKRRIDTIRVAMLEAIDYAKSEMKKGYSKELIEIIFQQPYTRISTLDKNGIAKRDAASTYLRELDRIGLLRGMKVGREMFYLNAKLLEALTA